MVTTSKQIYVSNNLLFGFQSGFKMVRVKLNEMALTFYTSFTSVIGHVREFVLLFSVSEVLH